MIVVDEDNCIVDTARYFLSFTQSRAAASARPAG